jgi:hypothetical protein
MLSYIMSIVTLKKKSAAVNSKNHSKRGGNVLWAGTSEVPFVQGYNGFSLNGTTRNVGYVGQHMRNSKAFTPFRGVLPVGHGGSGGKYNQDNIIYNVSDSSVDVKGTQNLYNKSSVLSTYGMLRARNRCIYNGVYPNVWVQPDANNGAFNNSQGLYISKKSSANNCVVDTNDSRKYIDNVNSCGGEKKARLDCKNNYSKSLGQAVDCSTYINRIQQKCSDPSPEQMPFPYAVNNDGCNLIVMAP